MTLNLRHTMTQGDRLPSLRAQAFESDGVTPYDLTGATSPVFNMRAKGGAVVIDEATATIEDAATGWLRYDWADGDTATAGDYEAEFQVTISTKTLTIPTGSKIKVKIVAEIA